MIFQMAFVYAPTSSTALAAELTSTEIDIEEFLEMDIFEDETALDEEFLLLDLEESESESEFERELYEAEILEYEILADEEAVRTTQATGTWLTVDGIEGGQICFDSSSGTITDAETTITSANIPSTINGVTVTTIGVYAFAGSKYNIPYLTSVVIPDSVTILEDDAFEFCGNLTSINIPDSVTSIGCKCFRYCTSLSNIDVGDGVMDIGEKAFQYCTTLTDVIIGDKVAYIGQEAFRYTLLTNITMGSNVVTIDSWAFAECNFSNITLPDSLTSIGDYIFNNCDSLTSINLPDDITSIGTWAFYDCDSLTSIDLPAGLTTIGFGAFYNCDKLTSINLPDNVTTIYDNAFYNCNKLTSINLPDNVTTIGNSAFCNCYSLTNIYLPASVTTIGDCVFCDCNSLSEITVDTSNKYFTAVDGVLFNKNQTELICYPADKDSSAYVVPASVTTIGNNAFYDCDSLTIIDLPAGLTSIDENAFCGCSSFTSIDLPAGLLTIGEAAFRKCNNLTSITLPAGLSTIGEGTFSQCYSLENITLPAGLTSIGEDAFFWCNSLTSIDLPAGLISIGETAFRICDSLESITLPASVTTIGYAAFKSCESLTDVYYSGTEAQWNAISIGTYNTYLTDATIHYLGSADSAISDKFTLNTGTDANGEVVNITCYFYDLETTAKLNVTDFYYTNGALHVALNGYYTIDIPNYTVPDDGLIKFPLVSTSTNTYISAVLCNGEEALGQDIYVYTDEDSFTIEIFTPLNKDTFTIMQDSSTLITGGATLNLSPQGITEKKALSVQVGSETALTTKIEMKNPYEDMFTELSFGDKIQFTIPNDVPIIGGGEIKIDFTYLPIYYAQVDNTVRFGIGTKQDVLTDEADWVDFKKFIESNQESYLSGKNSLLASDYGTATMGTKTDIDMEVYGFAEGTFTYDDVLQEVSGNLIIKMTAKASQEWQTAILSVPVVIKASLGASIEAQGTIGLNLDDASLYIGGEFDVVLPSVKLSGGVGVTKIGDISVYGSASNNVNIDFDSSVIVAALKGEMGISAKILFVSAELPLLKGSWQYYNSGTSIQSVYSTFSMQDLLDEATYTIDRSNLATQSNWLGTEQTYTTMSTPTMSEPTLLQSSVYANANPILVETDNGTQVLVWTADIAERSDGNHTAIVYSIKSGTTWSEPAIIEDDQTADFYPTVTTLDNDVYVAWMNANKTFDANVDLTDLSASCEITVAKLSNDQWESQTLTANNTLDTYPNLNTVDDTVYLVWTANSQNDIFSMTGDNTIYLASGDNWTAKEYTTVSTPITEVEVGQVDSQVAVSYIMIDDEISLYAGTITGNPVALAFGDLVGSHFETLDDQAILFWNSQDSASYTTNLNDITDLSVSADTTLPEFIQILDIGDDTYLVGAIGTEENGMYSYPLTGDTIGNGVLMVDLSDNYLTSMSAVQGSSGLDVVYLSTEVAITEDSVGETPNIYIASLTPYQDISIISGYYEAETDTGIPVVLTLQNTGLTTVETATITVTQDGSTIASSTKTINLTSGDMQSITIEIPFEKRDSSNIDYTFTATVTNDVNASNDSLDLTVGLVDVSVDTNLISGGDAISATVAVSNEGDLDTIVMLNVYKDSTDGELLATYRCGEITKDTTEYFQLDDSLLSAYAYQGTTLCFEVQSLDTEAIIFNNVSYEYVSQGRVAISATLENVSQSNGQLKTTVEFSTNETGCNLVVASYANGKMIDTAIKQVEIGEFEVEISLTAQGNEDEVVVYILDDNWAPLLESLSYKEL